AVENPALRLVEHVSIKEQGDDVVVVKVAKDNAGNPDALSGPELSNFKAYMNERRLAGMKMNISSSPAVALLLTVDVRVLPSYDTALVVQAIDDKMEEF